MGGSFKGSILAHILWIGGAIPEVSCWAQGLSRCRTARGRISSIRFCILDEVGAALDEANIGRFTAVRGRLGADWARASLALVSGGRKDRYQMLRRARQGGWAGQRLRFEARQPYPSGRPTSHGATRRPTVPT
jgi:hypothetical protein